MTIFQLDVYNWKGYFVKLENMIAERVAGVLKAVAHPVRLQIIELLEKREMCVGDIVDKLGVKQAITSQHLNMMRDKDVLSCRREGSRVYYAIKNKNVIKLLYCIYNSCDNNTQAT